MKSSKMCGSALLVAAVFFVLTFAPAAQAGGVDFHIGIGLPFPGYMVTPPPPPPPVVIYRPAPPPLVVVPPPYGYYRSYHPGYRYHTWQNRYPGHARQVGRHR